MRDTDKFRLYSDAEEEALRRAKRYRRPYKVSRNPDRHDADHGWVVVPDKREAR